MLAHAVVTSIDQQARLEAKLRRELGDLVLRALSDERTEDIVLNPDSRLWVKWQQDSRWVRCRHGTSSIRHGDDCGAKGQSGDQLRPAIPGSGAAH